MRVIALLIAALMVLLGLTGVLWPEGLMQLVTYSFTQSGIYVVAAVRVVLGVLLLIAARSTRTPKTMRVIGVILLVAGIGTALIPVERAQLMKDWWIARGPDTLRILACFPLAAGIIIGISALTAARKA